MAPPQGLLCTLKVVHARTPSIPPLVVQGSLEATRPGVHICEGGVPPSPADPLPAGGSCENPCNLPLVVLGSEDGGPPSTADPRPAGGSCENPCNVPLVVLGSEGGGAPHGLLRALQGSRLGRHDLDFFYIHRHGVPAVLALSRIGLIPPVPRIP